MFQSIHLAKKSKKGFTLIELVVVISILGILAVIAIPRLGSFKQDADGAALQADIRIIEVAAATYQAKYGDWPTNVSALADYLEANIIQKYSGGTFNANGKFSPPVTSPTQ